VFPADFGYVRAASLEHALTILDHEAGQADLKVLAGGQSLLPMMKLRLARPQLVVDIGEIAELKGVTTGPGGSITIGALTTYRQLQREPRVTEAYPAVKDALDVLADPQVRARGTIGGCVAHGDPAADLPAVLLALGAQVMIASRARSRTVRLDDFLLGLYATDLAEDELVIAITLPAAPAGQAYEKFEQPASRLPLAGVCAVAELRDGRIASARVAVTGIGPRPFRALYAERTVPTRRANPAQVPVGIAASLAEHGFTPLADQHATGPFRVHLAEVLAQRTLARAADRARSAGHARGAG
jgi:aerobic carbon-monoxide dehydrogenase medium subunit